MSPLMQVYVDIEGAYRDWLRARPELQTLVGRRVFLGLPERATTSESNFPAINVFRISSIPLPGQVLIDAARLQFDVWGPLKTKSSTSATMLTLKNLLESVNRGTLLRSGIRAAECYQITDLWLPDPITDRPRYVVQAVCCATAE